MYPFISLSSVFKTKEKELKDLLSLRLMCPFLPGLGVNAILDLLHSISTDLSATLALSIFVSGPKMLSISFYKRIRWILSGLRVSKSSNAFIAHSTPCGLVALGGRAESGG